MALFVRQDDARSELQQRVAAELREKAKQKAGLETERPDGIEDSQYLKDTKTTTSLAWVWALIIVGIVGLTIYFMIRASTR
jgi:hypothetical protein